jgi:hypothetical protein
MARRCATEIKDFLFTVLVCGEGKESERTGIRGKCGDRVMYG